MPMYEVRCTMYDLGNSRALRGEDGQCVCALPGGWGRLAAPGGRRGLPMYDVRRRHLAVPMYEVRCTRYDLGSSEADAASLVPGGAHVRLMINVL